MYALDAFRLGILLLLKITQAMRNFNRHNIDIEG